MRRCVSAKTKGLFVHDQRLIPKKAKRVFKTLLFKSQRLHKRILNRNGAVPDETQNTESIRGRIEAVLLSAAAHLEVQGKHCDWSANYSHHLIDIC